MPSPLACIFTPISTGTCQSLRRPFAALQRTDPVQPAVGRGLLPFKIFALSEHTLRPRLLSKYLHHPIPLIFAATSLNLCTSASEASKRPLSCTNYRPQVRPSALTVDSGREASIALPPLPLSLAYLENSIHASKASFNRTGDLITCTQSPTFWITRHGSVPTFCQGESLLVAAPPHDLERRFDEREPYHTLV